MIGLLAFSAQVSFIVDSFPGFHSDGECSLCHNEPSTAYNESFATSTITLDGLATEEFWSYGMGNQIRVPMANVERTVHEFIKVMFAQNATHIFTLITWGDDVIDGTNTAKYSDADGFAFAWNIDSDTFKDGDYFDGMSEKSTGSADMVVWKPTAAASGIQSTVNTTNKETITVPGTTWDYKMSSSGMVADTSKDYSVAVSWGYLDSRSTKNYIVEIARELDTGDANDATFDYNGYYYWNMALYNETSGINHWVAFPHQTFVHTGVDDPAGKTATITSTKTVSSVVTETTTKTETKTEGTTSTGDFLGITVFVSFFGMMILTYNLRKRNLK
jgi:hypothetical protein